MRRTELETEPVVAAAGVTVALDGFAAVAVLPPWFRFCVCKILRAAAGLDTGLGVLLAVTPGVTGTGGDSATIRCT